MWFTLRRESCASETGILSLLRVIFSGRSNLAIVFIWCAACGLLEAAAL